MQFAAYEEFKKVICFSFYLVLILCASLQNDFFRVWQDAVLITFEESDKNLWWIENIDSIIFEDTQSIIQKIANKNTNMNVLKTKKITSKSDGFIKFKHATVNDFYLWASGEVSWASKIWELLARRAAGLIFFRSALMT